eukprot:m.74078 g.74078  ORF g.74078 m.74078 type:complete len:243 (-) comp8885_c0_seq1:1610-2338(-)
MGQGNAKAQRMELASKTGVLSLEDLKLKAIPPEVKDKLDAQRLRTLSVSGNVIEQLPPWLPMFTALKTLDLQRNHLSDLPDIARMVKLETLNLRQNRFVTVPPCVFELKSLKSLNVSANRLAGVAPEGFSRLHKLQVVDLSENGLQALPTDCHAFRMEELNLDDNALSEIDAALAKAPRLRVLRVARNKLKMASIPPQLLSASTVNLIVYDGNPVSPRQFQAIEGYDEYEKRFTASKKKMMR